MNLLLFTDGGSLNNPGPAAYAFVVSINNQIIASSSKRLGNQTNNFAEYSGLVAGLGWIKNNTAVHPSSQLRRITIPQRDINKSGKSFQIVQILCHSDSELMVNQLNGRYKVKNGAIRDFILKIRILEQEIQTPIIYTHIPREKNQLADSLVKKMLGK